jgi:hypothetical protein
MENFFQQQIPKHEETKQEYIPYDHIPPYDDSKYPYMIPQPIDYYHYVPRNPDQINPFCVI